MNGDGDLFAGLSLSNSPKAKRSSVSLTTANNNKNNNTFANGNAVTPSSPPLAVADNSSSSFNSQTRTASASSASPSTSPSGRRVESAPVTDKFLALFGGGDRESNGSAGIPPPAPLTTSVSTGSPPDPPPSTPPPSDLARASTWTSSNVSAKFSPSKTASPGKKRAAKVVVGTQKTTAAVNIANEKEIVHTETTTETKVTAALSKDSKFETQTPINSATSKTSAGTSNRRISERPPPLEDPTTSESLKRHSLRGVGVVKDDTPIPNCDVALRLFRKFASKTRRHVPESHGGTQPLSLWTRYISGTPTEYNTRYDAYQQYINVLGGLDISELPKSRVKEEMDQDGAIETDVVIDAVLGASGDTMAKAREATATFCHLMSVWSHASAHMAEAEKNASDHQIFCAMVATGYDTATSLVTHGCLDGVMIGIGPNKDEFHKAVEVLAESVFSSDLSQSANELSAMKFLLSTGCRVSQTNGDAMLRGSHLLQTIRVLYHVYLSTDTEANKTTARASLQQLVTSVFIRMIFSPSNANNNGEKEFAEDDHTSELQLPGKDDEPSFPTENHRDAFLVLRSLCKLSMRSPPFGHNLSGVQTSMSSPTWDTSKDSRPSIHSGSDLHGEKEGHNFVTSTHVIHPALESKILALDLLLYVLNNTDMKGSFLQECGPQFHYAIRNYLCVSLLKNCTSDDTRVVNLSLRVFVPIFQNFRSILKTEIEAFVTNVFFVILHSKNSPIEHKSLVVTLFDEICSDPTTLAEIFLNYDCDLSAVDLFHRIVNTLSKVSRTTDVDDSNVNSTISLVAGSGAARMERMRSEHRELRLNAMRALRQVLASLHASIVEPMRARTTTEEDVELNSGEVKPEGGDTEKASTKAMNGAVEGEAKKSLVQIYDSKKKHREEESEIILRFNQKPKAGIAYASKCEHVDGSDPADVARFLLENKDKFEKTQIGEFLGREPDYEQGFSLKVLHEYVNIMDFEGLLFDDAIRYYLSGFRLPGEAQKIDRIMEKFAERYTEQNPQAFPTADVAFILSFSIIMLNTDLHNPAIKEERRMTKEGFIRNNRGISDGQDLPQEMLTDIFDRIKENPISLKEDDDARERAGESTNVAANALSPAVFFTSHYDEMEKTKESNFNKERDHIIRTTESLLKRRRHSTLDSGKTGYRRNRSNSVVARSQQVRYVRTEDGGLRNEYVKPMYEVTWGPALAAFSTAMESANGTVGALLSIARDEELEAAAINAAETIEVCLTGFKFAICTGGLVGNDVARDAYMLALSRFSQLGTGVLLEPRHVRCIQTMLALARSDGELLGSSWEHIFRALSEINRFHQLFQLMARNDRAIAAAAERRRSRLLARERRHQERERRKAVKEASDSLDDVSMDSVDQSSDSDLSYGDASSLFDDSDEFDFNDDMGVKEIDEANARTVYEAVSEEIIEAIYERSSSMSTGAVKEFILQLCRVSRMEISHYGGFVASDSNEVDLTKVQYRKQHELLAQTPSKDKEGFHHHQTNIYNLQKLVEVTHYNMDSRPRLVFADIWTTVSAHLTSTALHSNPAVAMYAVDSFRQLCTQYLQREELGVFEFQRRFLKPLETVMARSEISTTKELLLKCVERIILMFGTPRDGNIGMLRSGWRPVLAVLGLAGRDQDEEIAKIGFGMLNAQIKQCLEQCANDPDDANSQGVLLVERFVDLVDALLVYVEGPHEEMSLQCIDNLLKLCDFLADESTASPLIRKRRSAMEHEDESDAEDVTSNQELELWWPILLGLSRSIGDSRKKVRRKGLEGLTQIITIHFFPNKNKEYPNEAKRAKQLQTLQLVYRGILSPVLEFAGVDAQITRKPDLPSDFERFLTGPKAGEPSKPVTSNPSASWLDTFFDQFMDGCIQICLKSIEVYGEDTLVEEICAMLNNCLISDSGALAVKGLRRLEQFVSSDLKPTSVSDDTWATVSHMLRRCLAVRGLPRQSSSISLNGTSLVVNAAAAVSDASNEKTSNAQEEGKNAELEEQEAIREFVAEDSMLLDRRYIGSNTVSVIGKFLESERFEKTLGLRWRLFLVSGLGKGIREWENAAVLLATNLSRAKIPRGENPPSYFETAYYGQKWMNRFLLRIAAMKEIEGTPVEGSRQAAAQSLVKEQTQALVTAYLEKEAIAAGDGKKLAIDIKLFERLTSLTTDMLAGYAKLPDQHLSLMSWLVPVLSSCIHTSNEDIRLAIQKLVKRLH